jgi:hypothetical protein
MQTKSARVIRFKRASAILYLERASANSLHKPNVFEMRAILSEQVQTLSARVICFGARNSNLFWSAQAQFCFLSVKAQRFWSAQAQF